MKKTLVLLVFATLTSLGFSQEKIQSKYGEDSVSCITNLSVYVEFVKTGMYDYALDSWRYVFANCPAASKNMYTHGAKIMKNLIKKEKNKAQKENYIDTLLLIYDQRIQYFGQEGYVLGRKGLDLLKYRKSNFEEANEIFTRSVELSGNNTEPSVIVQYLQTTSVLFQKSKKFKEEVIEVYAQCVDILDYKLKTETSAKKLTKINKAKDNVDIIFDRCGAANCESLIALYTNKFKENSDNVELLEKITTMLDKYECIESDLFMQAAEALYPLKPSALAAYNLAKLWVKKGNLTKSANYYKEAISLEEDSIRIAKYYYDLGNIVHSQENHELARSYAYKSLNYKSYSGKPYLLIGKAYAAASKSCGKEKFYQSAVYWVAVDKFVKARNIDTTTSVISEAKELIKTYSKYFPGKEEAFFYNVIEGNNYTVECWINETTKVRFK